MLFGFVLHRKKQKKILLAVLSKKVTEWMSYFTLQWTGGHCSTFKLYFNWILKVQTFIFISFKVHLAFGQFTNILKHILL